MSVTVTLHVFSGRTDPAWELTDDQVTELADRLSRISKTTFLKPPGIAGPLGYRGFTITSVREKAFEPVMYVHAGIVDSSRFGVNLSTDTPDLEDWLLSTGGTAVESSIQQYVTQQFIGGKTMGLGGEPSILLVPPFNPAKWNNDPSVMGRNNCYNYANDKITNTFAQPAEGVEKAGPNS